MRTVRVCPRASLKARLTRNRSGRTREKIGEDETVARDDFTDIDGNGKREHRAGAGERVELAVFAAGIDGGGKIGEKLFVKGAAGEADVEFFRVDTGEIGAEAPG